MDVLSRPLRKKIAVVGVIIQLAPFTHEVSGDKYVNDVDFGDAYQQLKNKTIVALEENEYHLQDGLLYKLGKLRITQVYKYICGHVLCSTGKPSLQ